MLYRFCILSYRCRITEDIPWNIMGAQNLCAAVAESAWILLLDADILIPADQIGKILGLPR
jgi:hypothetical protein